MRLNMLEKLKILSMVNSCLTIEKLHLIQFFLTLQWLSELDIL